MTAVLGEVQVFPSPLDISLFVAALALFLVAYAIYKSAERRLWAARRRTL